MAAVLFSVGVLISGCETVDRRIAKSPEIFASFEPDEQELIRQGKVAVGFTPEMVRIAWGRPDRRKTTRTERDESEVWEYLTRRSQYAGRRFAGYHQEVFFDRRNERHRTVWSPVYVNAYQTVESERGRVEFRDGRVVSVTTVD